MRTLWTILMLAVVAAAIYVSINFLGWMAVAGILCFAVAVVLGLLLILLLSPLRWYVAYFLAKYDFFFTNVPESYCKEVVRFGGHLRTLLSKKGHKINKDGDIVELAIGELPEETPPGGLRVVGWPFMDRVYTREMRFSKSMPDGSIKEYDVLDVGAFYAKVDYPYALPFVKCEDKNNLPILGHATLLANIKNPQKSLFATANFYDTMVGLALPVVRECFEGFTFDELKGQKKEDLDERMWKELGLPQPGGAPSVIDQLRDKYGVCVVALRIVNIDPPPEYRDITLTKWKAEREADAAESVKKAEAIKAAGPIDFAMEKWVQSEQEYRETPDGGREPTETISDAKRRLRKSGEYKEQRELLADQINRSRRTVQERKVDITSGGKSLAGDPIASIAGTIVAAVISAAAGKDIKDDQSGKESNPGGSEKRVRDMTREEQEALRREQQNGT